MSKVFKSMFKVLIFGVVTSSLGILLYGIVTMLNMTYMNGALNYALLGAGAFMVGNLSILAYAYLFDRKNVNLNPMTGAVDLQIALKKEQKEYEVK